MGLGQDANFLAKSWGGYAPSGCEKGIQANLQNATCACHATSHELQACRARMMHAVPKTRVGPRLAVLVV